MRYSQRTRQQVLNHAYACCCTEEHDGKWCLNTQITDMLSKCRNMTVKGAIKSLIKSGQFYINEEQITLFLMNVLCLDSDNGYKVAGSIGRKLYAALLSNVIAEQYIAEVMNS